MTAPAEMKVDPQAPYSLWRMDYRGEKSFPDSSDIATFDEAHSRAERLNDGRPEKSDHYYVLDRTGSLAQ